MWLLAQKADSVAPTAGRAIDHIGWRVTNLNATAAELKANGVKFTSEPRAITSTTTTCAERLGQLGRSAEGEFGPAVPHAGRARQLWKR